MEDCVRYWDFLPFDGYFFLKFRFYKFMIMENIIPNSLSDEYTSVIMTHHKKGIFVSINSIESTDWRTDICHSSLLTLYVYVRQFESCCLYNTFPFKATFVWILFMMDILLFLSLVAGRITFGFDMNNCVDALHFSIMSTI